MSFGFHAHPAFNLVGAADAQIGKPSSKRGSLSCNSTYELNMGFAPTEVDLAAADPRDLRRSFGFTGSLDVLAACPPCTGFSRTTPANHLVDDSRNSLVTRTALFIEEFEPRVVVMENARELLSGNFAHHFENLRVSLEAMGYQVHAQRHMLNKLGLPQVRERALVVATAPGLELRTLEQLWDGFAINSAATTVRHAIGFMPRIDAGVAHEVDPAHVSPMFSARGSIDRLKAIPHDGGSWRDLWAQPETRRFLTEAMHRTAVNGLWGNHPDVYGRMSWDRPAPTVKRECGHVGNGRYAHPEQDRLLSLREMAIINGFPHSYRFGGSSLANKYRHVGDAVPPLISYQLAWISHWILTGERPSVSELVLPECSLSISDIVPANAVDEAA
jgi:DNA (cytosine-5)-methyltransferase 1